MERAFDAAAVAVALGVPMKRVQAARAGASGLLDRTEVVLVAARLGLDLKKKALEDVLARAAAVERPVAPTPARRTEGEPVGRVWVLVIPRPARMFNERLVRGVALDGDKRAPEGALQVVDVIVRHFRWFRPGIVLACRVHEVGPGLCRLDEKREPQAWSDPRFPGHVETLQAVMRRLRGDVA